MKIERDYNNMVKHYGLLIDPKFIRTLNKRNKDRIHTFTLEWGGNSIIEKQKIVVSGSLKYFSKKGEPSVKLIVRECTWTSFWGRSDKLETRWITKTNRNKSSVASGMTSLVYNRVSETVKYYGAAKWSISNVSWDWSGAIEQPREQSEKA